MQIEEYLRQCNEIAALCSQNGWIDNDTLTFEPIERGGDTLVGAVRFEELVMEGAGCLAGRVPCYGRVRVELGPGEDVRRLEVI